MTKARSKDKGRKKGGKKSEEFKDAIPYYTVSASTSGNQKIGFHEEFEIQSGTKYLILSLSKLRYEVKQSVKAMLSKRVKRVAGVKRG